MYYRLVLHGNSNIKFIVAKQAKEIYKYLPMLTTATLIYCDQDPVFVENEVLLL